MIRFVLCAALYAAASVPAAAEALYFESPGPRVSLLELYTSEGCSSCPPADGWIRGLRDDPRLWREVVPEMKVGSARWAIAAWVSRGRDPRPLQAVGGWLN